jgi:hypothetical protein
MQIVFDLIFFETRYLVSCKLKMKNPAGEQPAGW